MNPKREQAEPGTGLTYVEVANLDHLLYEMFLAYAWGVRDAIVALGLHEVPEVPEVPEVASHVARNLAGNFDDDDFQDLLHDYLGYEEPPHEIQYIRAAHFAGYVAAMGWVFCLDPNEALHAQLPDGVFDIFDDVRQWSFHVLFDQWVRDESEDWRTPLAYRQGWEAAND